MRFNGRKGSSPSQRRLAAISILLVAASLACVLAPSASTQPMFIAPEGINHWTSTLPPLISEELLSTPIPEASQAVPPGNPNSDPESSSESSPTPAFQPEPTLSPTPGLVNNVPILYYTQAGDTLPVVAVRYGVQPEEITSPDPLPETNLLAPGQLLLIPNRLAVETTSSEQLMPDSEVVFSPSAADFDVAAFVDQAGGFLSTHKEFLGSTGMNRGADVVSRVAIENSINPRMLLALLEYESGMVYGPPADPQKIDYAMGKIDLREKGLYNQLTWAVSQLSSGFYGWREGRLTEINFSDGVVARLAPDLNAGTAAVQYFFGQLYDSQGWEQALDTQTGFPALYERMYGNPWIRAQSVEPLYPPDLVQPPLILPFALNQVWAYTGGPHGAWERDGAWAAIDFAPGSLFPGCVVSETYAVASASGLVVRSRNGVVAIDLDGDGREQTGWVLMYLHIATKGRIPEGTWVEAGDPIGHPSCEGGFSTGTHIHLARKYNGEWIVADGPLPFVLSGWRVHAGQNAYEGTMTRGDQVVRASTLSPTYSQLVRRIDDP
jgi:LasA protease